MDNNLIMEMTKEYSPVNRDAKLKNIMEKWDRTGLLKKLNEDKTQIVAQLLENQAVELRNVMLNEESQTGGIAGYNKIAFPLVRRVFGQLLATELVAVQPMNLPSGLLFYLDFKYERTNGGATAGGSVYGNLTRSANQQADGIGAQDGSGGFYNFSNVGYSRRNFILSTAEPAGTAESTTSDLLGATVYKYDFTLANGSATDLTALDQIRVTTQYAPTDTGLGETFRGLSAVGNLANSVTGGWANAGDAVTLLGYAGEGDFFMDKIDPTLTTATFDESTGNGTVSVWLTIDPDASLGLAIKSGGAGNLAGSTTGVAIVGPAMTSVDTDAGTNNLGDFESTSNIPEINIAVSSVPVQAITRKLKATWTPELAQDINAYHAIDAEVELTTILSDIISTEIDREILGALLDGATVAASWSRVPGKYANGAVGPTQTGTNSSSVNLGFTGTNQDWYQTLAETILSVSNEIHKRTMRSGANWMVTSPDVATIIEAIAYFKPNATFDPTEVQYSMGIEKVGTLSNRFTVYKDPYFPSNKILVGYKGAGFLDAGFVYAPYVPLVFTPTIFEPNDFTPRKGAMTRYASQMVRPEFYGVVTVNDLSIVGV